MKFGPLESLKFGRYCGVLIDDTGSPGLQSRLPPLDPDRKTWVGVVVNPEQARSTVETMSALTRELKRSVGADEFHSKDVYGGKGRYNGTSIAERLVLFKVVAEVFRQYSFPIYVQTVDPRILANLHTRGFPQAKLGIFDLNSNEGMALLLLLMRLKKHIDEQQGIEPAPAQVFIDEGMRRAGVTFAIPGWENTFAEGKVRFVRSSEANLVALADFAAFVLNRQKILLQKDRLSELDLEFLRATSEAKLNFKNIPVEELDTYASDWQSVKANYLQKFIEKEKEVGITRE